LTDEVRDEIRSTLLTYKVVFFRDQELTREQHAAFARRFGPLYDHPTTRRPDEAVSSAIHRISADDFKATHPAPDPLAPASPPAATAPPVEDDRWDPYHTDTSWRLVPTWGAVLRAVTLPEIGGDTIWVDAALAYRALPEDVKARLEGLHVTHDYRPELLRAGHADPIVAHPVIRLHRETGERVAWVNFTQKPYIVGLDRAESRELLTHVIEQYRKPEHQMRFTWRSGSVAFWDNRAAVHYAVRNYGDFPRLLERILIADDPLYADL
jgi:taurine dioxygenase